MNNKFWIEIKVFHPRCRSGKWYLIKECNSRKAADTFIKDNGSLRFVPEGSLRIQEVEYA